MKNKKRTIRNFILCTLAFAVVITATLLPKMILRHQAEQSYNVVTEVPTAFYSGPSEAVVKNASKQLSCLQKLQLISGIWDSEITDAKDSETNLSELDAKELAISKLISLSADGLYPVNVDSDYQKWYSWTATPYKAVDTTFRTYAAIYWDVTFTKYDNTESHRIIITESGDVLFARASSFTSEKSFGDFTPKLANIGYLFLNGGDSSSPSERTIEIQVLETSENTDTSESQLASLLSSAESYIKNLNPFDIKGSARFETLNDTTLHGTFLYGTENEDYTFLLHFN